MPSKKSIINRDVAPMLLYGEAMTNLHIHMISGKDPERNDEPCMGYHLSPI